MGERAFVTFDHDTVRRLKSVLEEAWASLPPDQRKKTTKSQVAERILKLAARGERDPQKLRLHGMSAAR